LARRQRSARNQPVSLEQNVKPPLPGGFLTRQIGRWLTHFDMNTDCLVKRQKAVIPSDSICQKQAGSPPRPPERINGPRQNAQRRRRLLNASPGDLTQGHLTQTLVVSCLRSVVRVATI